MLQLHTSVNKVADITGSAILGLIGIFLGTKQALQPTAQTTQQDLKPASTAASLSQNVSI